MTLTEFRDRLRDRLRDRTSLVGDMVITSVISPTRHLPHSSLIIVTVSSATTFGTVTVYGMDGVGVEQNEVLTFTCNGEKTTVKIFSKKLTKIECSGFTAGTISVRCQYKDFDDVELDGVITGALEEYSRYKNKRASSIVDVDSNGYYPVPIGALWIYRVSDLADKEFTFEICNNKIKVIEYYEYDENATPSTIAGIQIRAEYATAYLINEIPHIEPLILCAEALCDRMKSEEPDRWVGISISVPGIEKLDVSSEFRIASEKKMTEFRKLMRCGYGCRG